MSLLTHNNLNSWVIDSGALDHKTFSDKDIRELRESKIDKIAVAC